MVPNLKVNLAGYNLVQITNFKQKILGEESKLIYLIKFGVCTTEIKLVTFLLQEHLEMTVLVLLELHLCQDSVY